MALSSGTRFGPYEILSSLGAGGAGNELGHGAEEMRPQNAGATVEERRFSAA
jgi:hypothetical protein